MAARRTRRIKALVLDRTKLGEQDLILTCLTDTGEELRAVAKGARRPGGRLAARTELFSEVDMLVAEGNPFLWSRKHHFCALTRRSEVTSRGYPRHRLSVR